MKQQQTKEIFEKLHMNKYFDKMIYEIKYQLNSENAERHSKLYAIYLRNTVRVLESFISHKIFLFIILFIPPYTLRSATRSVWHFYMPFSF